MKILVHILLALVLVIGSHSKLLAQSNIKDGMRIKTATSPEIYFVIDREKHHIKNYEIYDHLFADRNQVQIVTESVMETIPTGAAINQAYLLKGSGPEVYFVMNKVKRHITSPSVFDQMGFDWGLIKTVKDKILDKIKTGKMIELNLQNGEAPGELPCGVK